MCLLYTLHAIPLVTYEFLVKIREIFFFFIYIYLLTNKCLSILRPKGLGVQFTIVL